MPDEIERQNRREDDRVRDAELRGTALSDHDLLIRVNANVEQLTRQIDIFVARADSENGYVTRAAFAPVRNVVYGLVALILSGVFGGLIALVVKGK